VTTNIRRLGVYMLLSFAIVSGGLGWWQVVQAPMLAAREDNPEVLAARRSAPRGTIFDARGEVLASTQVADEIARRSYTDVAFTHLIGYASLRFGATGIESAWDDVLAGRADPNPVRDLVDEILGRGPRPRDLVLTVDRRLQDEALSLLGNDAGAVVAIEPRSGAILALVSSPTFDATPLGQTDDEAAALMAQLREAGGNPLLDRARLSRYIPGSIMKLLTTGAALETGAITPETTFPDQPREEVEGFVVDGFRITEHELGNIRPALWPLSEAMQVSSNIYFAHVGLELGGEAYLTYARRAGFCEPLSIGPAGRRLFVEPSWVTSGEGRCGPFADRVELANAAYGQAHLEVTPFLMAQLAATIANDGVRPEAYVVREVRADAEGDALSEEVIQAYGGGGGSRIFNVATARQLRGLMVDAVHEPLGRIFAGAGNVQLHGMEGVLTAGKTGTAQRGEGLAPHSWFIGFAAAGPDDQPSIAVAVIVEGGGAGSGRAAPVGGRLMATWLGLAGE
jgi:peptidoglycan glycosyltransferase